MLLSTVLLVLSTSFKVCTTTQVIETSTANSTASIDARDSLDKWVDVFKGREGDNRMGGIKVHRLLEVDPLPPQNSTRIFSICLKYSESLAQLPKNSSGVELKKAFWRELKPLGLSLIHPLCAKVMADCGDVLTAEDLIELNEEHEVLICNNLDFISRIPDFSLMNPSQVLSFFESSIVMGLNLARIPNVIKTLKPESLIKLMEMMSWDLEDWEMRVLVDACGGVDALIKDFGDHLNSWNLIIKFPWVMQEATDLSPLKSSVDRLLTKLETKNYSLFHEKSQIFTALINLIVSQEFLLSANLFLIKTSSVDETLKTAAEEMNKTILVDKMRLKGILKESEDFGMLYVLSTTPLSPNVHDDLPRDLDIYENELPSTLVSFLDTWKQLIISNLGDTHVYVSGSTARILIGLVIANYSDEEFEEVVEFFKENRLNIFHIQSILSLKRAWPFSEKVNDLEKKYFTTDEFFMERSIKKLKNICVEASENYSIFLATRFVHDQLEESISSWVEFHLRLQVAGALIKQYDHTIFAKRLLPSLLEEDKDVGALIQEYPNIFLCSEVIDILLDDQTIFKTYPRLLHGLIDYKQFNGTHFQSLSVDFSKIRRGLSTIPMIQLVNYMKSKQGLIDDPISLLAAVPKSTWESQSFAKHFTMYYRAPMAIEDIDAFLQYVDVCFIGPKNAADDAKSLLWAAVKFVINTEVLYQELKVTEPANLTGKNSQLSNFFISTEAFYRPLVSMRLLKKEVEDEALKPFYAAVIKTLQSVPLSRHRLEKLISTVSSAKDKATPTDLLVLNLFPSFALKSADKNYTKSLQNFKVLINKLAETEEIKVFWLYLLAICAGDVEEITSKLEDERIPIYYRVLGKRTL